MMSASFVALVESIGVFIAVPRYASATPLPPSILCCGVGWQGVAILFSGLFGTRNGSTVSVCWQLKSCADICWLHDILSRTWKVWPYLLQFQHCIAFSLHMLFNDMINYPFSSKPFVAGMLALFLDVTLLRKDNATRKDRGMHWWDKFRSFKMDTRSEEFYSLPFNLNKFFPSV